MDEVVVAEDGTTFTIQFDVLEFIQSQDSLEFEASGIVQNGEFYRDGDTFLGDGGRGWTWFHFGDSVGKKGRIDNQSLIEINI